MQTKPVNGHTNGHSVGCAESDKSVLSTSRLWLEEELQPDMKWCLAVTQLLHVGRSDFQSMELLTTSAFGKVLLLDGKIQSCEGDEFMYHELLVQPAMLSHPNPKTVFICGGGEGATAREVLKHKSVEKVVMVDIDKDVCDFCREHLEANHEAWADPRLELINNDAKAQLEASSMTFDVIIGDLADPLEGGPCYQLYTDDFYRNIVLPKLNPDGIFVTQSGPAGVMSAWQVYSPIHHTMRTVFPQVLPYNDHIPSFVDRWGWNMGFADGSAVPLSAQEFDERAKQRLGADALKYLDGATYMSACNINKVTRKLLAAESTVLTVDNPRFIHGEGVKTLV